MEAFEHRFYTLKDVPGAFDNSVAENYIQHNARILSGRGNLIEALSALFASADNTFDIKRLIVDRDTIGNDIVVMHLEATNTSGNSSSKTTVVDMYRLQGTCIVEHWDVLQEGSASAINPLAYF